jgi:hypothetical protein
VFSIRYSNVAARIQLINSSGNRIVASHSARRNCLFADRPCRTDPTVEPRRSNAPRPIRTTQPYLCILSVTRFIPARSRSSDPDPHSAAAHPPPPPLLEMRQPPASLLAGAIKRRSWPSVAAGPGPVRGRRPCEEEDDHGGSQAAAAPAGDGGPPPRSPRRPRPPPIR